jgi:hypothetical protein
MGGKSEIRVSLEDEPGTVSRLKWLQAETRQHATKFFLSGNSKSLEDHCQVMTFAPVLCPPPIKPNVGQPPCCPRSSHLLTTCDER